MKRVLERRSGARDFHFDLDSGRGSFRLPQGQPLQPQAVELAVREAGFELLELGAEVLGRLQAGDDVPRLRIPDGQEFALIEGHSEEERSGLARLREWLEGGGGPTVVVRGAVHAHAAGPPGLTVREFRIVGEAR